MFFILCINIFIIGLLFGSFATVLITRWHNHEGGIFFGRSKCPKCHHTLSWYELFPLFSYVFLGGRCRKCRTKIPLFYPFAEILMGSIFLALTYAFWKNTSFAFDLRFILIIFLGFITGVYVLSDLLYMEIPDQIMAPGIFIYLTLLLLGFWNESISYIFFDRVTYLGTYRDFFSDHILGAFILYTFLYLQILIPAALHFLKKRKWKDILGVLMAYFTLPYYLLFPPKNEEEENDEENIETWVGGGDLRIALFIGITLGISHGIFAFFVAYMIGSFIGIIVILLYGKKKAQIPFGPFLATGWLLAIIYHSEIVSILDIYKSLF